MALDPSPRDLRASLTKLLKSSSSVAQESPSRRQYRWDQFRSHPNFNKCKVASNKVRILSRKICIPRAAWVELGSPVYVTKDEHIPTGELHVVPSEGLSPQAYRLDLNDSNGRLDVRVYLGAAESLRLRRGTYDVVIEEVLGRKVLILRNAYPA